MSQAISSRRTKKNSPTWTNNVEKPRSIHDFIAMPFRMFALTGLHLFSIDSNDRMTLKVKMQFACTTVLLIFNMITMCLFPVFKEFEDTLQKTAIIVYVGFATNGIFKVGTVWLGRNILHDIVLDMLQTFPRTAAQHRDYRMNAHYVKLRRCLFLMVFSHGSVGLMFQSFPITTSLVEYFLNWREDGQFVYRLPYIMVYPFDEHQPLWYCFAYTVQFVGGVTISSIFLGSDMMMLTIVYLVNIEFEYLAHWIRRIGGRKSCPDIKELKAVMQFHNRILEFSKRIDGVFSMAILLNYVATSMVTCLIGFLVVLGSDFLYLIKFTGFLVASIIQIYYMSSFSTNMIAFSSDIAVALSEHNWYDADISYQRLLPLAIARAQRPAFLTANKFIILSMESFTSFMTTSYQFFALIKTRYEKENQQL